MKMVKTKQIADLYEVQPLSVLQAYSRNKHYQGLIPVKLPNGQLRWDYDEAVRVLHGEKTAA